MIRVINSGLLLGGFWLIWSNWHEAVFENEPERFGIVAQQRLMLMVGLCLWGAATYFSPTTAKPQFLINVRPFPRLLLPLTVIGIFLIVRLSFWGAPQFEFYGMQWQGEFPPTYSQQLRLYFGGLVLFVLGTMRVGDFQRIGKRIQTSWAEHGREWVVVLALTLLAFGVRVFRLENNIPLMISDETLFLHQVHRIKFNETLSFAEPIFWTGYYMSAYPLMIGTALFGNTLFAGRIIHVMVGALAVPGVYMMVRRAVNVKAAVLACLFFASQPIHVHFSRTAVITVFDPTFGLLAVLLVWDGLERGGYWKFALAGVLLGYSQYFYVAGLLWLVLIPLWLAIQTFRQPQKMLRHSAGLGIMVFGVFLALLPLLMLDASETWSMLGYSEQVSGGEENLLLQQPGTFLSKRLAPAIEAYIDEPDATLHYGEPGERSTLNLRWGFLLFGMGLVYALRRVFNPAILFILMWIGLMTFTGGALAEQTPGYSRYTTAMLPLSMLAGMGALWFGNQWAWIFKWRRWLGWGIAWVPVVCAVGQNIHYIHVVHPEFIRNNLSESRWRGEVLATASAKVADKGQIYFLVNEWWDTRYEEAFIYYTGSNAYNWVNLANTPLTLDWLAQLDTSQDSYFYVPPVTGDTPNARQLPPKTSLYWLIKEAYPQAEIVQYDTTPLPTTLNILAYHQVYIPRGAVFCGDHSCKGEG